MLGFNKYKCVQQHSEEDCGAKCDRICSKKLIVYILIEEKIKQLELY